MKEIWKEIPGYEGLYEASTMGNFRSLDRSVNDKNGKPRFLKGRILRKNYYSNGYEVLTLCMDSIKKQFIAHRIVATLFVPNPANLPEVNHKDENKKNNSFTNLEWLTHKQNMHYGTGIKRRVESQKGMFAGSKNPMFGKFGKNHPAYGLSGSLSKSSIPIARILDGKIDKQYPSLVSAANDLGVTDTSICYALKGRIKTCKGYQFKYLSELNTINN